MADFTGNSNRYSRPATSFALEEPSFGAIRVIGVGGAGCNAVNRMIDTKVQGIDFCAVNTDKQALDFSKAQHVLQIGEKITRGLGAGADPEVGESAAVESKDQLVEMIEGADMLFITAGMGGGTGTGAAPVVAEAARELGILTVAVVTRPFKFEGSQRLANAEAGIRELEKYVDALIIVPNDKLIDLSEVETTVVEAFAMADQVLVFGVTGISDLITIPGLINLDMADIRRVMTNAGICHMGIGRASGEDRVERAIDEAINSPLLDTSIDGAQRLIVNFTAKELKMNELNSAATQVRDAASPNADIIIGSVDTDTIDDDLMITIIASGFEDQVKEPHPAGREENAPVAERQRPQVPRSSPRRRGNYQDRPVNPARASVAPRGTADPQPRENRESRAQIPDFLQSSERRSVPRNEEFAYEQRPREDAADRSHEAPYASNVRPDSYTEEMPAPETKRRENREKQERKPVDPGERRPKRVLEWFSGGDTEH